MRRSEKTHFFSEHLQVSYEKRHQHTINRRSLSQFTIGLTIALPYYEIDGAFPTDDTGRPSLETGHDIPYFRDNVFNGMVLDDIL
jgi:hypothetical protein